MGYSRWSSDTYTKMQATYSHQSRSAIFRSTDMHPDLDPRGLIVRESRDSVEHPNALAIGVFLDVTGSMGRIPEMLMSYSDCGANLHLGAAARPATAITDSLFAT